MVCLVALLPGEGGRHALLLPRRIRDEAPLAAAFPPQAQLLEHDLAALQRRREIDVRMQPVGHVLRIRELDRHDVRPAAPRDRAERRAQPARVVGEAPRGGLAPDEGGRLSPHIVEAAFVDLLQHVLGALRHRISGDGLVCAWASAPAAGSAPAAAHRVTNLFRRPPGRGRGTRRARPAYRYSAAIASV
ncbi:hypothetical protein C7S16_6963 [Burkholderia thailandensis]|uniref:Uncharacterized protein n=1 Tax=Burkholderia thailandensis TaxID=57975 RepID=A0AAW9CWM2_BURTH|nr:hypothetical protein [Burkholderia thailandensis]MDW9253443.1 hypothetical protein [Burkholderia thailandensis]